MIRLFVWGQDIYQVVEIDVSIVYLFYIYIYLLGEKLGCDVEKMVCPSDYTM